MLNKTHKILGSYFTIVELLIVVSLLVILVSLLQPSLQSIMEGSRRLKCQNNLSHIGLVFTLFANDNDHHLPGSARDNNNPDRNKHSWMGNEVGYRDNNPSRRIRATNREGTIWPYLGKVDVKEIYRCPSLETGVWDSGIGSNGLFDYIAFQAFAGAKIDYMPSEAYYPISDNDNVVNKNINDMDSSIVPLVSEEDPKWYLNRRHIEPAHGNLDRLGNWHNNGINIVAPDGSTQWIDFSFRGPYAREWKAKGPSGQVVGLSGGIWGWWNSL